MDWIVQAVAIFLVCVLISNKKEDWAELSFPVAAGLHIAGLRIHLLILMTLSIVYVVNVIGIKGILTTVQVATSPLKFILPKRLTEEHRQEVKERKKRESMRMEEDEWASRKAKQFLKNRLKGDIAYNKLRGSVGDEEDVDRLVD